ncbi:type II toxin-antitoxin system Phd/YefM family antitoxin [Jiella sonneratiae]|uniref:Antitoxin n=1 Tax=Jiella sonneratiae TaxID=2816856 RepID=A0ABS3J3X5_9HYPH|nr:type II toxin-antitoxin system Phd/YefM family antitoxin [Jiella sonneratiae]MBO0904385.1 type II toxin-antitoxin system Phd/YefM family antitoxin [Jiella sonneratiae]
MRVHERQISAREFNQNASAARKAANDAPLVVTDHGRPTHVLMSYEEYERLKKERRSVLDLFADPSPDADFDFQPQRDKSLPREVDFD